MIKCVCVRSTSFTISDRLNLSIFFINLPKLRLVFRSWPFSMITYTRVLWWEKHLCLLRHIHTHTQTVCAKCTRAKKT